MESAKRWCVFGGALAGLLSAVTTTAMAQERLSAPVTVVNGTSDPVPVNADVINNEDHPVPVRVMGGVTQNVNVTNNPLPVQNVNDPARNAISFTASMEGSSPCHSSLSVNIYNVPQGQRLVIESINMGASLTALSLGNPNNSSDPLNTGVFELLINSPTGPNGGYIYYFPLNALPLAGGYKQAYGSFSGKIYADPGSTVTGAFCTLFNTGAGPAPASYTGPTVTGVKTTFSGYLVNTQ